LEYKGENYWKTPIYRNITLLDDITKLIDTFIINDRLMGTELLRDQLNYCYKNIKLIFISNEKI